MQPGMVEQTNDGWLLLEYQKGLNNIEHDRQWRKRIFYHSSYSNEGFISAFRL